MKIITLLHSKYKAAYWSENILLKLSKPKNIPKDTELIVRCWDNRVKGRDGILTEIKINLIKLDPHENKVKLRSKDRNFEIVFEIYYILNENPKASSEILNNIKLKKDMIGMMLIKEISLEDLSRVPGHLEIKLGDEIHSTNYHYKTVKQTGWKYPISFLIKRSSNTLIIKQHLSSSHRFPYFNLKINSYSSELEKKFWDDLLLTGSTKIGPVSIHDNKGISSKIGFRLSFHKIIKLTQLLPSGTIPISPPLAKKNNNQFKTSSDKHSKASTTSSFLQSNTNANNKISRLMPSRKSTAFSFSSSSYSSYSFSSDKNPIDNSPEIQSLISFDSRPTSLQIQQKISNTQNINGKNNFVFNNNDDDNNQRIFSDNYVIQNLLLNNYNNNNNDKEGYKIYTGKNIRNDVIVIIKIFSNEFLWENEMKIIKQLKSSFRYILKFQDTLTTNNDNDDSSSISKEHIIVMEYFGKSLDLSLDKFNSLELIRELFLNICKGVQFLHNNEIVVRFSAPELVLNLNSGSISHYAIDIYSLGCLLYYLVTKHLFYTTTTNILLFVELNTIKEKIANEIDNDIINILIIKMLDFMFDNRPTIDYTLKNY
ncbi:21023_t:CDS:2 [Entrophospora sp. SA101]|nr:21023_t:CDS:2 [Entrophospora sp. SA101]